MSYLEGKPDLAKPLETSLQEEKAFRGFLDGDSGGYCSEGGRYRWSRTYSRKELQSILSKGLEGTLGDAFQGLPELETLEVLARTPNGRVAKLRVAGGGMSYQVEGDSIRWLFSGGRIGTSGLQSTLFYVLDQGDNFEFKGGGWGHGVGLCQQGAAGRAKAGQSYREILSHYYPGTTLSSAVTTQK